jgi:ABC-type cobalamin/Fe3+-siderophores transport system ATPase subunit
LKGIDLNIAPGEYIGIVGASGCGKSTLLKLLLGFEEPDQGQICYDGKNLRQLDKREVRKNLGVVLQNGRLMLDFQDTRAKLFLIENLHEQINYPKKEYNIIEDDDPDEHENIFNL